MSKQFFIKNRKASYDYFFLDEYTAGIQLFGSEVKSISAGKISMVDAFCYFDRDELYIKNLNIVVCGNFSHDPLRVKKLLLKKSELSKLNRGMEEGTTIIPVSIFTNERGKIKIKIALSKGKRNYDKRIAGREKEISKEIKQFF